MATNLRRNISYLSLSQLASYVFPLIIIPYITRVLGPSAYALTEFAGVIMVYFVSVVEFGFFTTATRKVAQIKDDPARLAAVFAAVLSAKFLLMLGSTLLLGLLILVVPKFFENAALLLLSIPMIIGASLNPDFLFLGTEKAGKIALANVFMKGLATTLIFLLINGPDDYLWLNFINGSATIGMTIGLLWLAFREHKGLKLFHFDLAQIKAALNESRFIFISNFSTRLYGFISIPMGGFLMSPQQLGLFAAASKLINVGQNVLFQPLHGALFPHLSNLIKQDRKQYLAKHRKFVALLALAVAVLVISGIFIAPWLVPIIFGQDYLASIPYLQWMAPILFIGVFAHLFLQQGLLVLGKDKIYMRIVLLTGLLSIGINYILISQWQAQGAAYARILTESILALLSVTAFYKYSRP